MTATRSDQPANILLNGDIMFQELLVSKSRMNEFLYSFKLRVCLVLSPLSCRCRVDSGES